MLDPHSLYSSLEIHMDWKVDREARIEPPIHTEYFLSGGKRRRREEGKDNKNASTFFISTLHSC